MKRKTLKQEIKALKNGQEKIFNLKRGRLYLTVRKTTSKGLQIIAHDNDYNLYILPYEAIENNFKDFTHYDAYDIED